MRLWLPASVDPKLNGRVGWWRFPRAGSILEKNPD
jgi:hypothetical protein